jgi:hypothetical protein
MARLTRAALIERARIELARIPSGSTDARDEQRRARLERLIGVLTTDVMSPAVLAAIEMRIRESSSPTP